jgi:hypothetical protein
MTRDRQPFFLDPDYEHFEPGQSRLKLSTLTGTSTGEIIFLVSACLLVCLVMVASAIATEVRHRRFMHEGVETTFTVTACSTVRSSSKNSTTYTAHLTFTYWTGDAMISDGAKLKGKCEKYPLESHLTGLYLPDEPYETEVMSLEHLKLPFFFRHDGFLIGLVLFAGLTAVIVYQARKGVIGWRKRRRLHENGLLLEGQIASTTSEYRNKSQQYYVIIHYRFESPERKQLTGRQERQRDDLRPDPPPGCSGTWFSREKPKRKPASSRRLPIFRTPVQVLYADESTHIIL